MEATLSEEADALDGQLVELDPRQVALWRAMSPAERLEVAFQAYQFVLDAVRASERERHPDLSPEELAWRVTRRIQGDATLGRQIDGTREGPGQEGVPRAVDPGMDELEAEEGEASSTP